MRHQNEQGFAPCESRRLLHAISEEARLLGLEELADFTRSVHDLVSAGGPRCAAQFGRAIEHLDEWLRLDPAELIDSAATRARLERYERTLDASHADTPSSRRSVLLVDDSAIVRMLLSAQLEEACFEVRLATSGAEALDAVRERRPSLVLTDLEMPGMSGFELLEQLGALEPALPVIVLSSEDRQPQRARALSLGAADYVVKTHDSGQILSALNRASPARARA